MAHHGELLQGVFSMPDGPRRALVSLPCPRFGSTAEFRPSLTSGIVAVGQAGDKARQAAELALTHLGRAGEGGELRLRSNIPPGWGLGSSTADVVAAVRAVAAAFDTALSPETIAQIAVRAETASDSTMFGPRCVLFAHRDGGVLAESTRPLPRLVVLGCCADEAGVPTLEWPPAGYTPEDARAFDTLAVGLFRALAADDRRGLGEVATAGVVRNAPYLPEPLRELVPRLLGLVQETGALGCQVAHSGTVAGLLFDPDGARVPEQVAQARTALTGWGVRACWAFGSPDDPPG